MRRLKSRAAQGQRGGGRDGKVSAAGALDDGLLPGRARRLASSLGAARRACLLAQSTPTHTYNAQSTPTYPPNVPFPRCSTAALVFLNGSLLGLHRRPRDLVDALVALRRRARLGEFVSVHLAGDSVQIASDSGRVCRPLIICDGGVPRVRGAHLAALKEGRMDFVAFLRAGLIEYLGERYCMRYCSQRGYCTWYCCGDSAAVGVLWWGGYCCRVQCLAAPIPCKEAASRGPAASGTASSPTHPYPPVSDVNEESTALIALYPDDCLMDSAPGKGGDLGPKVPNPAVSHLEIEPFTVLGVVAGLIPYPHHNQSPRNTYQARAESNYGRRAWLAGGLCVPAHAFCHIPCSRLLTALSRCCRPPTALAYCLPPTHCLPTTHTQTHPPRPPFSCCSARWASRPWATSPSTSSTGWTRCSTCWCTHRYCRET